MSSGYGGYRVESPAEIERRRLASADVRYERACRELAEVELAVTAARKAYGDLGVAVPRPARIRGEDAEAMEKAAAETEAATAQARAEHEAASQLARARAMTGALPRRGGFKLADLDENEIEQRRQAREQAEHAAAAQAAADNWAVGEKERFAEVERVAARLPADADAGVVRQLDDAVQRALVAEDEAGHALAMAQLREIVAAEQKANEQRSRAHTEWAQLHEKLDGLSSGAVDEVRTVLASSDPDMPPPTDLMHRVESAAASARAESDKAFVLDAVVAAFADLGYEIDDNFAGAVENTGEVVPLPWSRAHGVQVREREGHLLFNVVRFRDRAGPTADPVADQQAEQRFCDDYDRLISAAAERGVTLHLARTDPAGLQPLQEVDAEEKARAAGDQRRQNDHQTQERRRR